MIFKNNSPKIIRKNLGRARGQSSGQAMVESAIAMPIFLILVFLIIEGGLLINAHSLLKTAAFGSCRRLAMEPTLDSNQLKLYVALELSALFLPKPARRADNPFTYPANIAAKLENHLLNSGLDNIQAKENAANLWYAVSVNPSILIKDKMAKLEVNFHVSSLFPLGNLFNLVLGKKQRSSNSPQGILLKTSIAIPLEVPYASS